MESGWRQIARTGGSLYCPKSHRQPTERWPSCREPASRSSSLPAWVEPVPVPPHQVLTPIIYPPLPILPRPPHQISNLGFLHLSKQQKSNISVNSSFFSPLPILCLFLTSTGRYICTDVLFQHFHQKFVQDSETNVWKRERQPGHFVMSISGTSMLSTNWLKIKEHVTPPALP